MVALAGYRGTANLLKIIPTVQAAGIAEIGNTAGAKSLREPHVPGIFHVRASTTDEIEAAVNHAWTIGINRIGAMYQDDAFGKEGLEAFVAALKKRGAAPAAVALLRAARGAQGAVRRRDCEPGGALSVHRAGQPGCARIPDRHLAGRRQEIQLQQHGRVPERQAGGAGPPEDVFTGDAGEGSSRRSRA
ncbi:MAG: ABC transporter substrate-binding protein [Ramlibacter sp.]